MQLFYQPRIADGVHALDAEESKHVAKVLRLRNGDSIQVTDGKGSTYTVVLTDTTAKECSFEIKETTTLPKPPYSIHIAIAPTKNMERTEWFVEKATEIGVNTISFMQCKNSERKSVNFERIQKKVVSALKQSGQPWMPELNDLKPFKSYLDSSDSKFIAYVDKDNPALLKNIAKANDRYLVLIGPEGDFSPEELGLAEKHGFLKVSLGPNRLRTETAGIAACHILNLINQ